MKEQNRTFDTGDINLVAAAMSIGIPLNPIKPCSLVLRDNGHNYARYHMMTLSLDGRITTDHIADWWSKPSECTNVEFAKLMDMIGRGLKQGVRRSDQWLDFIIDYLTEMGIANHPKNMAAIPDFIAKDPDSTASHMAAFAYNREHAFELLSEARRRIMVSRGSKNHACIDTHLPDWKKKELLARLSG